MKLKTILMMLLVALCTVACSNDDETTSTNSLIAGTYHGTLEMTVANNQVGSSNITVTLTQKEENTASISIVNKEVKPGGMNINRIEFDGISVINEGNEVYTLSKNAGKEGFTATDKESPNKTVWTFKSFSGQIKKGILTLHMLAQPGAMPMPITLKFTSEQ